MDEERQTLDCTDVVNTSPQWSDTTYGVPSATINASCFPQIRAGSMLYRDLVLLGRKKEGKKTNLIWQPAAPI